MARHKPSARKRRMASALKTRRSVPTWVVSRTRGHVRSHPKKRHWRKTKMKP